ncbi:MAG: outer membrane protein transport protein [Proteobacteria bacterium]|nr:outer membrane protein transport protein [Pseudomonadota bacterium]
MPRSDNDVLSRKMNQTCGRKVYTIILVCLLTFPLISGTGFADEDHYNNLLIGDRATGLGGAYTAISDDPSGLYYNPAGIVYATTRNLTASVNAFNQQYKTYKNALAGGGDFKRKSSTLLPNFLGVVQPLGKGMIGFSIAVPDSINEDQDQTFSNLPSSNGTITAYNFNLNHSDSTIEFGPSYAMEINKSLSVGMTLYFHYREKELIQNNFIEYANGDYLWANSYYQTTEYGMQPLLGIMWSPVDKLALGLRVGQVFVYDSYTRSQYAQRSEITATATDSITMPAPSTHTENREQPTSFKLGAAWFLSETMLLSGDFSYYTAVDDVNFGDREATWNIAMGMEKFFSEKTALRLGIFTNNANTKDIEAGKSGQGENIDFYGFSVSLSKFTRNTSISGGFSYSTGSGDAQLFSNTSIQDVESYSYTLYLSTSYSF